MKKITVSRSLSFIAALFLLAVPMVVGAQITQGGGGFDPLRGSEGSGLSTATFYEVLITILQYGLVLLTILAVIGFIISGLIFITAGGAGKADTARSWLIYSIVGVLVGLIGYIVITLIDSILVGTPDTGTGTGV